MAPYKKYDGVILKMMLTALLLVLAVLAITALCHADKLKGVIHRAEKVTYVLAPDLIGENDV